MQDKVLKLMTAICLLLNMSIAFSAEEKIEISVKKSDTIQDSRGGLPATKEGPFSFLLNGMRQALTAELVKGEINPEKAARAAQLSFEKYCSVSKTMEPNVTVNYEVYVNGEKVGE